VLKVGDAVFQARNLLVTLRQFIGGKVGHGIAQNCGPLLAGLGDLAEAALDPGEAGIGNPRRRFGATGARTVSQMATSSKLW
jgi:hypothetical protein